MSEEDVLVWNGIVERRAGSGASLGISDMIWEMTAGELLREVRRRHGLTQAQLAARARTSQAAISRIERGQVSPSVAMLARLLDLMGEELRLDAEPIDYGIDRTLLRENLRRTPEERIDFIVSFSNFLRDWRGTATRS